MTQLVGHILVVDDNQVNRMLLTRALHEQSYTVTTAENGQQALELLRATPAPGFDVVLLDVLMPELDGYQTLARIKQTSALQHLPVIMISAVDELESVISCIELGATDYLPKPFNAALLRARLTASLASKRLRDQEVEYLRQVERLAHAAAAVEAATFEPESLAVVAGRTDALGQLARVFQRMAREVYAREQRLKQQLQQLRLDLEERQQAAAETVAVYVPMDRRQALASGAALPEQTHGAALFADISGFTPLTEALAQELGLQRGAEEITRQLNRVYGVLIDQVHRYGGSVLYFSGDAITCWFDDGGWEVGDRSWGPNNSDASLTPNSQLPTPAGLRAVACALAMQTAMEQFTTIATPAGTTISLAIKVAIAAGTARRFLVGTPQIQHIEVLVGRALDELVLGEHLAKPGDVLVQAAIVEATGAHMTVADWRADVPSGARFAIVTDMAETVPVTPWPDLPALALTEDHVRPWLLPAVYERVRGGKSEFLSELRPAAVLFLAFQGIDYARDDRAGAKLDAFVRHVQAVLLRYDGALLQLTIGDKGSYLYAAFGAPIAHEDDAARAVAAALDLQSPPAEMPFITNIQIGIAYGQMRTGAYGSVTHRTYGVLGDKTNLAARLMQAASGGILCDETIEQAARTSWSFEALPPIKLKGKAQPVAIYRPLSKTPQSVGGSRIDELAPAHQLTLKVASVIGSLFSVDLLRAIYPSEADKSQLGEHLEALNQLDLVAQHLSVSHTDLSYVFKDPLIQETSYNRLLFAQRRQLHRAVAEWHERHYADDLAPYYALLAQHWSKAEDMTKAILYLERAGERAQQRGDYDEAIRYFNESLALIAAGSDQG